MSKKTHCKKGAKYVTVYMLNLIHKTEWL